MFDLIEAQCNWYVPEGTVLDRMDGSFPYWIVAQYLDALDLQVGSEVLSADKGSVLILPPFTPHRYVCEQPLHHHWIHLQGDVQQVLEQYDLKTGCLYGSDSKLDSMFRTASFLYHGRDPYRVEYMRLKVEEILVSIAIRHHLPRAALELNSGRLQDLDDLRNQILEYPEQDWSIPNMAARMYISEPYFYTIYHQRFGISPAQDVQNIRLERACVMLRDGIPVAVTAERCGYRNVYHFIRQFKKVIGTTPGKYADHPPEPESLPRPEGE